MKSMYVRSGSGASGKRFPDHHIVTLTNDDGQHAAFYNVDDDQQRVHVRWRDTTATVALDGLDAPTRAYRWLYSMVGAVGKKGAR